MHRFAWPLSGFAVVLVILWNWVTADPQTNLLGAGCSTYNVTDAPAFFATLNGTLADIRYSISANASSGNASSGNSAALFATAKAPYGSTSVFALFQCRAYLSAADCLACLAVAETRIRRCGAATGARVIYDGCIFRYESTTFFDQTTAPGNAGICGSSVHSAIGFSAAAQALVRDLAAATPRTAGFFAATERDGVFAVAQCVETVSGDGCGRCLVVADANIEQCLPASDGRAVDAGCFMRYSNTSFFPANRTLDLSPFLNSGKSRRRAIIVGIVVGVACILLLGVIAVLWINRSRGRQDLRRGDILGATELQGPVIFHYKDLKAATENFSQKNKLGEGGFGEVYKGVLKNGNTVAVKRLAIAQTSRAKADFQSEVKLISNVHHRNLVRLLGCSSRGHDFLLVYEYMANSSLDKFLFGDRQGFLNWKQRFNIIVGMARGLAYLHDEFHVCIIHRDIKSSNVLVDDDFQPKIADFGLARLLPEDKSHLSTKFAGTLGYTAPEYAIHGQLSEKVDTYSYGVVVLEIISGRKSNNMKIEHDNQYLLESAWNLYGSNSLIELVDRSLDPSEFSQEEVSRVIKVALLCTQSTAAARPTMSQVILLLLGQSDPKLEPERPLFIDAPRRVRENMSSTIDSSTTTSHATVSVTTLSAR